MKPRHDPPSAHYQAPEVDPKGLWQLTGYATATRSAKTLRAGNSELTGPFYSNRRPRFHKPGVAERSAGRCGFNTMNYRRVVSQPIHHSGAFYRRRISCNRPHVQSRRAIRTPGSDTGMIHWRERAQPSSLPELLAYLRQTVDTRRWCLW